MEDYWTTITELLVVHLSFHIFIQYQIHGLAMIATTTARHVSCTSCDKTLHNLSANRNIYGRRYK